MLTLNMGAVLLKVDAWKRSPAGKKRMQQVIDNYVKSGVGTTQAGSRVVSYAEMS